MKKSQLIALWIYFILWALTLGIWYAMAGTYGDWGFTEFFQATFFWSLAAGLTFLTLKYKKKHVANRRFKLVFPSPNRFLKYWLGGVLVAAIFAAMRDYRSERFLEFSFASIFGLALTGLFFGGIAYLIWGKKGMKGEVQASDVAVITQDKSREQAPLEVQYFAVSTSKLIILSICTFGLYEIYWFYQNWKIVRNAGKENISPFWRALFCHITSFGIFKRIMVSATHKGFKSTDSAAKLAWAFFLIVLGWKLPDPYWLVSLLSFVPILSAQKAIKFNNQRMDNKYEVESKFSWKTISVSVVGGGLFVLVLIGLFFPQKDGLVKEFYDNGRLKSEANYKEGILDGIARGYFESGEVEWENTYKDGKLNGIAKSFYKSGQVEAVVNFIDGQEEGEAIAYYENGDIARKSQYVKGKIVEAQDFDLQDPAYDKWKEAASLAKEQKFLDALNLLETITDITAEDEAAYQSMLRECVRGHSEMLSLQALDAYQTNDKNKLQASTGEYLSWVLSHAETLGIPESVLTSFVDSLQNPPKENMTISEYRDYYKAQIANELKLQSSREVFDRLIDVLLLSAVESPEDFAMEDTEK